MKNNKLIVILGPTSSGKTALAVKLAKVFKGEIVSADSRQVYQSMDIGTGKDKQEYGRVPYHLLDVASPKKQFTLARYQKLAYSAINNILKRNKIPFLVGGSGLYLDTIIKGYTLPVVKPNLKLRQALSKKTLAELQVMAKKSGLKLNDSDFKNQRRLIRKLEAYSQNAGQNKPSTILADRMVLDKTSAKNSPKYDCLILGLNIDPKKLAEKIAARIWQMLKNDTLIKEVKKLKKAGLSWKKLDSFGLEYRFTSLYVQGKISRAQLVDQLNTATRQFVKRQLTWFKRNKNIIWLSSHQEALSQIKKFLNQWLT